MKPESNNLQVVKAELLWSRSCPLKCSYCNMVDGRKNTPTLEQWEKGIDQLKKLDCSLVAIYGAEPMEDFDKLPEVIQYAESIGINTTVITSGVTAHLKEKLQTLYKHGLRSITTSFDAVSLDTSSANKSAKALEVIDIFRSFGPVRDSAVVVTLTKHNYLLLPDVIRSMSAKNIWTFFDLIHPDRGQAGSKVKTSDTSLLFDQVDYPSLISILKIAEHMKNQGFLVHTSKVFFETMKIVAGFASVWDKGTPFNKIDMYKLWNCAVPNCFPSWVTVDCDGSVYPCDDFQPKDITDIKVWEIADRWHEFSTVWKSYTSKKCPGCLWGTHIDAHLIKEGKLPLTDYIHGLK